jgi:hypothetical protein
MVINPYLRVGRIPLHHKYCHNSENIIICGVSAPVCAVELYLLRSHYDGSP